MAGQKLRLGFAQLGGIIPYFSEIQRVADKSKEKNRLLLIVCTCCIKTIHTQKRQP
jgi:hypothetical protein